MELDWTGRQISETRKHLESRLANILGCFIMEFARLERDLGLFLAWEDDGAALEIRSLEYEGMHSFKQRLNALKDSVESTYGQPEVLGAYEIWLADADMLRIRRNRFVHGRWGARPTERLLENVLSLPTSPKKDTQTFSVTDMEQTLQDLRNLVVRLRDLRNKYPV